MAFRVNFCVFVFDWCFGLAIFCDNVFSDWLKFLVDFLNLHNTRLRPNINYVEIVLGWQKPVLHPNDWVLPTPLKDMEVSFFFHTWVPQFWATGQGYHPIPICILILAFFEHQCFFLQASCSSNNGSIATVLEESSRGNNGKPSQNIDNWQNSSTAWMLRVMHDSYLRYKILQVFFNSATFIMYRIIRQKLNQFALTMASMILLIAYIYNMKKNNCDKV